VIEKEVVGDFLVCLYHLSLTLALDLENIRDLVNVSIVSQLYVASVIDVCPDDFVLGGLNFQSLYL
jgi:hypothetical protein